MTTNEKPRLGVRMVRCRECGRCFNAREAISEAPAPLCGPCATAIIEEAAQHRRTHQAPIIPDDPPTQRTKRSFTIELQASVIDQENPTARQGYPIRFQVEAFSALEAASALGRALDSLIDGY